MSLVRRSFIVQCVTKSRNTWKMELKCWCECATSQSNCLERVKRFTWGDWSKRQKIVVLLSSGVARHFSLRDKQSGRVRSRWWRIQLWHNHFANASKIASLTRSGHFLHPAAALKSTLSTHSWFCVSNVMNKNLPLVSRLVLHAETNQSSLAEKNPPTLVIKASPKKLLTAGLV